MLLSEMEEIWAKKVELLDFTGTYPIGLIVSAERFSKEQEFNLYEQLHRLFMCMEGLAMLWFHLWCQKNLDLDWKSFGLAVIKRLGDKHGGCLQSVDNLETKEPK